MNIYLGNLSIEQIEREYQVQFSEEDKTWLKEHRQANVSIVLGADKWHCFDFPRIIAVGSADFRQEIFDRLKNYAFKGQIGIGVMEDKQ